MNLKFKSDATAVTRRSRGLMVARFLSGFWRPSTASVPETDLEAISDILLRSGCGGLAWSRVRGTDLEATPCASRFRAAYRHQSLQAALHERNLKRVIPLMNRFGVDPVLVKGWTIARRYPEAGMRPYVDFDFCVRSEEAEAARAALREPEAEGCLVDLHVGFDKFQGIRIEDVYARTRRVELGETEVRVLGPEDELRLLCVHLLRHGVSTPLWLCDLALVLENLPEGFDWDLCLSGTRREADYVACALGLVAALFGLDLSGTPVSERAKSLPTWMVTSVLNTWGTRPRSRYQLAGYLRHPLNQFTGLMEELPAHWPNPIEATMTLGGAFTGFPRFPFQVGHLMSRSSALMAQVFGRTAGSIH